MVPSPNPNAPVPLWQTPGMHASTLAALREYYSDLFGIDQAAVWQGVTAQRHVGVFTAARASTSPGEMTAFMCQRRRMLSQMLCVRSRLRMQPRCRVPTIGDASPSLADNASWGRAHMPISTVTQAVSRRLCLLRMRTCDHFAKWSTRRTGQNPAGTTIPLTGLGFIKAVSSWRPRT